MELIKNPRDWLDNVIKNSKITKAELGRLLVERKLAKQRGDQIISDILGQRRHFQLEEYLFISSLTGFSLKEINNQYYMLEPDESHQIELQKSYLKIARNYQEKYNLLSRFPNQFKIHLITKLIIDIINDEYSSMKIEMKSRLIKDTIDCFVEHVKNENTEK